MATPAEKEETRFTSRIKHTHAQAWNTHTQAQAWNTAYLFVEPVQTCAPLAHQLSHVDNQSASTS